VVLAPQALSRSASVVARTGMRYLLRRVTPHYSHTSGLIATVGRMMGDRWGVTAEEVARHYPCDDVISPPVLQLWRGVTVEVPAGDVWPWLCQLRLAPYSYDWLDNLGRRSPRELRGLPDPEPGERFSRMGGRFGVGRVLSVGHDEHLTARIMGAAMSYALIPEGQTTRLVLKIVMKRAHWYTHAIAAGDWPMARRQLKNLKALAEGS
jgi:hypothetical protein